MSTPTAADAHRREKDEWKARAELHEQSLKVYQEHIRMLEQRRNDASEGYNVMIDELSKHRVDVELDKARNPAQLAAWSLQGNMLQRFLRADESEVSIPRSTMAVISDIRGVLKASKASVGW
ncbi:hypothetical protein M3J07_002284 [Ascochyta lentis]